MSRITKLGLTGTPSKEYIAISKDVSLTRKVTSIGQGTSHDTTGLSILNVAGSSPGPYQVFMGSGEGSNFVVGDALYDEAAVPNKYLVIDISGDTLTVFDSTGVGAAPDNSGTSFAAAKRYYNGSTPITDWESELDDTDLYASGDDVVGECYNDAVFSQGNVNINGGGTVGLNSITLSVASTERHDGTEGTGARWGNTTTSDHIVITTAVDCIIEWLDIYKTAATGSTTSLININTSSGTKAVRYNLFHSVSLTFGIVYGIEVFGSNHNIHNNIVYDLSQDATGSSNVIGIVSAGGAANYYNNTLTNLVNDQGTGLCLGYDTGAGSTVTNCIAMSTTGTSSGNKRNYSIDVTAETFSMSEDSTADGANCLINKVYADQFVSVVGGSEDYHLKSGADAIDAGTDLGTTPDGVNIDIDGNDRNGFIGSWDIGADQYYANQTTIITSIGQGTSHDNTTLNITAIAGTGPYLITMDTGEGTNFVIGDALWDEHSTPRKYRVIDISGDQLSVLDNEANGEAPDNSGTSSAAAKRYYNGSTPITDWESELDDTDLYTSGDDAIGECYNDSAFDELVTVNGGGTVGLNSIHLTVADGEKHDGTAGTGAGIYKSIVNHSSNSMINISSSAEVSWLELKELSTKGSWNSHGVQTSVSDSRVRNLIVHDLNSDTGSVFGIRHAGIVGPDTNVSVCNCIIYNVRADTDLDANALQVQSAASHVIQHLNCTVYNADYGITSQTSSTITNCIAMGCTTDFQVNGATSSYNMSSDATASGTGSLTSKTTASQFVSTVGGSEDLHLKAGADAIDVGSDLGTTPTDVNIDINGNDREGYLAWSIGAHNYALNIDDQVLVSIGQGTSHDSTSLTISSVAGTGPYLVSMNSAEGSNFVAGDALWDENATPRKYRVVAISTDDLSVVDSEGVGEAPDNSGTSSAAAKRYYNGSTPITDWESELDDTDLYASGDDAIGECYNDSTFDESVTIDGGITVGLNSVTLTAATGEKHDGTAGTGVQWSWTGGNLANLCQLGLTTDSVTRIIEYIDFNGNNQNILRLVYHLNPNTGSCTTRYSLMRQLVGTNYSTPVRLADISNRNNYFHNNILYNCDTTGSNFRRAIGLYSNTAVAAQEIYNCTIHNIASQDTNDTYGAYGYQSLSDATGEIVKNTIITSVNGNSPRSACFDFESGASQPPSNAVYSHNISSDTTASGTGSLTSKTAANQFVSTTAGSEDLHLKSGADAIGAGTDLGTTPDGVNIDIDGFDRNSIEVSWDIGADQFVTTVSNISNALVAFFLDF